MTMKHYIRTLFYTGLLSASFGLVSCEDYLDREPESIVSSEDAFKSFQNFQGFTEELYYCLPDQAHTYWQNSFNWGEDEIISFGKDYFMGYKIDLGDFWGWQAGFDGWGAGWMDGNNVSATSTDRFQKRFWPLAWYGIRKCNMGLQNLDMMIEGTEEQRNLIAGQLYFFRGWFHFMMMQYFGGMPYLTEVPSSSEPLRYPRLSYQECADLAAEDFRRAANLLPINWDDTATGGPTFGNNQQRINKIMALSFLGKNLLWAGSPLMNYTTNGDRSYDPEYCQRAAEAFAELLELVESGQTQYSLVPFEDYSDIFYTYKLNAMNPGSTEAIFQSPMYDWWMGSGWSLGPQYLATPQTHDRNDCLFMPTANYVNYYGMANGLPLDDPESGFDPTHPWRDRDPRFYNDITFDGVQTIQSLSKLSDEDRANQIQFANLYTGGNYRDDVEASRTGYLLRKFTPLQVNYYDEGVRDYGDALTIQVSWMRLADVYLMYAEAAANGYRSANGAAPGFSMTALDAFNRIRQRAGVGDMAAKYASTLEGFNSEIRRERAVELSYEGMRFNDLRRWLLLTEYPYTIKTSQEFDRVGEFNEEDPTQNEVANWREEVILTRDFKERHYWMPLKTDEVNIYSEYYQNPGW